MGKEGDISISSHILLYFPSPRPFWLAVLEKIYFHVDESESQSNICSCLHSGSIFGRFSVKFQFG